MSDQPKQSQPDISSIPYPARGQRVELWQLCTFARRFYQLARLSIEDIEAAKLVVPVAMLSDIVRVHIYANSTSSELFPNLDKKVERIRKEFLSPGTIYERE